MNNKTRSNEPKRQPLTKERIIAEAITLADRNQGEVSMRALGQKLGVDPMAVYRHFRNKTALLDAMVEAAASQVEIPAPNTGTPLARLRQAMLDLRRVMKAHPGLARHGLAMIPRPGSQSLVLLDQGFGLLKELGLENAEAARAYLILVRYVVGVTATEDRLQFDSKQQDQWQSDLKRLFDPEVLSDHPHLPEMLKALGQFGFNLEADFEYGLDLLLSGLAQRAELPNQAT